MKLVIVESPSKAKTLEKYLGKGYMVDASAGHVSDLPEKSLGVDVDNNFEPKYVINPNKKDVIERLKKKVQKADFVYLATDPDREGEAISWHLQRCLNLEEGENRIVFNEISKKAVEKAITEPRKINVNLVDAQQARRVLDRLVGYKLSPVLCKKISDRLSAGRVQSIGLRLIVEREVEIENFVPVESFLISLMVVSPNKKELIFKATLANKDGKKFKPNNKAEADVVLSDIKDKPITVGAIKKGISKSRPPMPFTTSTLQQDGVSKLNLSAPQVMSIAQNLYEGVDVKGEGQVALVTYIRTDSVRVSVDAQNEARDLIKRKYGEEFLPKTPNVYKTKKGAQDAHEAIRPISLDVTPESLKGKVDPRALRLYKLIYERFVASQMAEATFNTLSIDINCDKYTFKATGKAELFKGFTAVYQQEKKEDEEESGEMLFPPLNEGDVLDYNDVKSEQKFTKPPARFTDASLVKILEDKGIGRPSTYASIISVLNKRNYVEKDGKQMKPTELGRNVNEMVVKYFDSVINTTFTAKMEERLDEIEDGGIEWQTIIGDFYTPFIERVNAASSDGDEVSDVMCEKCNKPMLIKMGKYGKYLACSGYPDCKNIKSLDEEEIDEKCPKCGSDMKVKRGKFGKFIACSNYPDCKYIKNGEEEKTDEKCDKCGSDMTIKQGRFGKFMACSNYPTCKNIKSLKSEIVMPCPDCGKDVIKRNGKSGKVFYGCSGYPDCTFVSWDEPVKKPCPECGKYMVKKLSKKNGDKIKCSSCAYTEEIPEE